MRAHCKHIRATTGAAVQSLADRMQHNALKQTANHQHCNVQVQTHTHTHKHTGPRPNAHPHGARTVRHADIPATCSIYTEAPFTRYNLFDNRGCIVYTNIQPVAGLTNGCIVYIAGYQTGCTTGLITGCIV